jgi:molybdopterin-synthase adenylyltransferase
MDQPNHDSPAPTSSDDRYARQTALPQIGPEGQKKLAEGSVLIVGCGALGAAQAELVTRAGVGSIFLADRDVVEINNLQRQLLFDEQDAEELMPKAAAAARKLKMINSSVRIEGVVTDVTTSNIEKLIEPVDLVLDGTDNFQTRCLINDACIKVGKPWVYGGVVGTNGMVMAVTPGSGPCFRCILPEPPNVSDLPTCATAGVLNTAVLWVAALQVTEAFKLLMGINSSEHFLQVLDIWTGSVTPMRVGKDDNCPCCSQRHFEYLNAERGLSATVLCSRKAVQISPAQPMQLSLELLGQKLKPLGTVALKGLVLEWHIDSYRMVIFPTGHVIVVGTTDPSVAKSLVARYLGG